MTSSADIRARIDRIDAELVELLADRQSLAVRAPDQVEEVIARVREHASAAGLSPTVAEAVWRAVLAASADLDTRPRSGLPEADVARVRDWCAARVPERVRDQVRVECEVASRHLTVVERRPLWNDPDAEWTSHPIARLRFTKASGTWTLYWRDRNTRFHHYDRVAPTAEIGTLLAELERDPTAIFWG